MPLTPLRCLLASLLLIPPAHGWGQDATAWYPSGLQEASESAALEAFHIEVDTIATNIGPLPDADLTGYNTYRVYLAMSDMTDQLSAIYGGFAEPLHVNTSGDFFQSPLGDVTAQGIYPAVWGTFPSNEFDSFITIGIDEPAQSTLGEGTVAVAESSSQSWTQAFRPADGSPGSSFSMSDSTGGAWYVLPTTVNGLPGPDGRVLIAQLTTNGNLGGMVNAQIFLGGIQVNNVYVNLPFPSNGCTNPSACNYNDLATEDDGSCVFPEPGLDCNGDCLFDTDGDGVCNDDEIGGCTDPDAVNFNPAATESTPTCLYEGCVNPNAENYDPDADVDDGSCIVLGCIDTDTPACNYDPLANTDDGSCDYSCYGCTNPAACNYSPDAFVNDGSCEFDSCFGCTDPLALNYFPDATIDDGSCIYAGCTNPAAANYNPLAEIEDGSCLFPGCTYFGACNYDPIAVQDDASCIFPLLPCSECDGAMLILLDEDGDGVCDGDEIAGCTDPLSCAYNPAATDEDGSCIYADGLCTACQDGVVVINDTDGDGICNADEVPGCTYVSACNFDPGATDDNGTCTFPDPGEDCDGNCLSDADGDGICDNLDDCVGSFDALGICNGDCPADSDGDGICDTDEIGGCTEPGACNFDPAATDEDGSCFYADPNFDCDGNCFNDADGDEVCDEDEVPGCTDSAACNFDGLATDEDGSCTYPATDILDCDGNCLDDADGDGVCDEDEVAGCTDIEACNYTPAATDDDGSCVFAEPLLDCDGNCLDDADGDGICDADEIAGCQDATACNYDPTATDDDSSCEYASCAGCTDGEACNYDGSATIDDASCTYPDDFLDCDGNCIDDADGDGICDVFEVSGCQDATACNYDGDATDPADCTYAEPFLDCDGNCLNDSDGDGTCDENEVAGCTDGEACNYDGAATEDDGSCTYPADLLDCDGNCLDDADGDGICDANEIAGCGDPAACNYDGQVTDDDGSCIVPGPCQECDDLNGLITFDSDGDGICDGDEISGCTNPEANNYDPAATDDDGTCKIFGCTDMNAVNYNMVATDNDGLCEYLCVGLAGCTYTDAENYSTDASCDDGSCTFDCGTPTGSCVLDYDGNGIIGSADLVYFLGWYELECVE